MYIGTTFVKKYPMSNSVEIYKFLFQALTKSFLNSWQSHIKELIIILVWYYS